MLVVDCPSNVLDVFESNLVVPFLPRRGAPEVENALLSHPSVANARVVGVRCPERGQKVKAFVVVAAGAECSDALVVELQAHAKAEIAPLQISARDRVC